MYVKGQNLLLNHGIGGVGLEINKEDYIEGSSQSMLKVKICFLTTALLVSWAGNKQNNKITDANNFMVQGRQAKRQYINWVI